MAFRSPQRMATVGAMLVIAAMLVAGLSIAPARAQELEPAVEIDGGVHAAQGGGGYIAVSPLRILDTRSGLGAAVGGVGQGQTIEVALAGAAGIPADAAAVVLNLTSTGSTAQSFVTVFAGGASRPPVSHLNPATGDDQTNAVIVELGPSGTVQFFNNAGITHLVADAMGYVPQGGDFTAVTPARALDTRAGLGAPQASVPAQGSINVRLAGVAGVPETGVSSVVFNLTQVTPNAPTYATVYPAGAPLPLASNVNTGPGQTASVLVVGTLGANGEVTIYNNAGDTHFIADVLGWFPDDGSFTGISPTRVFDSRVLGQAIGTQASVDVGVTAEITDAAGVPLTGVSAVILSVTATGPTDPTFLRITPRGQETGETSVLNPGPTETVANLVVSKVSLDGKITIYNNSGLTHVIVDVVGFFRAGPESPLLVRDEFFTGQDDVVQGNVFADNGFGPDGDLNGDAIRVVGVTGGTVGETFASSPAGSLLRIESNGDFSYDTNGRHRDLAAGEERVEAFGYTASDGTGTADSTAEVTVVIGGENDSPAAANDGPAGFSVRSDETQTFTASVLANDNDPDFGDTLTVRSADGVTAGEAFTTDLGARATVTSSGVVSYDTNGRFDELQPGASREDTISYVVADASGAEAEAVLTVRVTSGNDAPVLAPVANFTVAETEIASFTASATDPDAGQVVRYSFGPATSATVLADGATINATNGRFRWQTGELDGPGVYPVEILATDDGPGRLADSIIVNITVTETNRAPDLVDPPNITAVTGVRITVNPVATDPDRPRQTLTFRRVSGPGTVNAATGQYQWTPPASRAGEKVTVRIEVSDGALTDDHSFTIDVEAANEPPVFDPIADFSVDEGDVAEFNADTDDPDGRDSRVRYAFGPGTSQTVILDGATIARTSGRVEWQTGELDGPGVYPIEVVATDEDGGTASITVRVTVRELNQRPTLVDPPNITRAVGDRVQFTASAADADRPRQTLTFRIVSGPGSMNANTGAYSWRIPASADGTNATVRIEVSDGDLVAQRVFTIRVR